MGDVDVVYHDGLYHLFHLVLPNHDFIAHAVSEDGLAWSRVENALFIGHPGSWDDSMLWTMHVSPSPHEPGRWRMFYTGIAQHDMGLIQRVGLAVSDDLYAWTKAPVHWASRCERCRLTNLPPSNHTAAFDPQSSYPIEATAPHYESSLDEGRSWISWRDPYYYHDGERSWLLVSGRVPEGPVVRRGCVAMLEEVAPDHFEPRPSLFHPGLYDDIEVPNLIDLEGQHYLVGSLREDAKIRYWHARQLGDAWTNYSDNVLLPTGNYAGRLCRDDSGYLIWNFYTQNVTDRTASNLMPPPKRVVRNSNGQLAVHSYEGFDRQVMGRMSAEQLANIRPFRPEGGGDFQADPANSSLQLSQPAGFQGFMFGERFDSFRLRCHVRLEGLGKTGLLFRTDPETQDGYYLSLDLYKGVAQLRRWGTQHEATGEFMMNFATLQSGYWRSNVQAGHDLTLTAFGEYLELTIDRQVCISLADQSYQHGMLGFYVESACLDVSQIRVEHLRPTAPDLRDPTSC